MAAVAKLKSTYADALVEEINPDTGRVHTSLRDGDRQHRAAVVDRSEFAEHSDPHGGRQPHPHAFIAEPGHVLVSADYSQIELRLLAHVADIPALKEAFARGEDIHARTASEVFGVPMEGMDPMTRRRAKAINFGIIYGISGLRPGAAAGHRRPGEAKGISTRISSAIPASATTWNRPRKRRGSRAMSLAVRPPLLDLRHRRQEPGAARPTPSGRRSMRRCRAARPTSSSAPWSGCRPRCGGRGCGADVVAGA
jgi:DNA polymerase-1